ncbi:MAG: NADH-quinone oxidoreductase subunit H [Bdellovibrionales bacterium]|nr:NADH-quinone oxidoreductase subunit H [Bdellovibrionales bacterium]
MAGVGVLVLFVKGFIVQQLTLGLASFCTWVERKGSALIQDRVGANRAGAFFEVGDLLKTDNVLLQPIAFVVRTLVLAPTLALVRFLGVLGVINTLLNDALKALLKEDFIPEGTSPFLHAMGPFMAVAPVFLAYAVVPLAPDFVVAGYTIRPQVVELNAGLLFLLAMGSLAVYGVILAGLTGNNKFSLLGALRASAQMISYELAMGTTFATLVLVYGSLDLYEIVMAQAGSVMNWGILHGTGIVSFIILFVVGMAETKRGPFDMPESESELVAGYFTEYSGMKFLLFWLGEFAEIALFSLILTIFFFGGWHIPFVSLPEGVWWAALVGHAVLIGKVLFFCVLQIVIRWTLPRFRYDQLMDLGWKILLPLSLVNLVVAAVIELSLK